MLCPLCGGNNLTAKREDAPQSKDYKKERDSLYDAKHAASEYEARYFAEKKKKEMEEREKGAAPPSTSRHCPLCGYGLKDEWKFCPECGVSLIKK
ncbi:MAG: zinc-ribbon domain-containing protein [Candidatus Thermoplasmatota archaeon]|nr:zinc-ribbon domain-containing protein [Candidatus Thermoplasmatota archaeon]